MDIKIILFAIISYLFAIRKIMSKEKDPLCLKEGYFTSVLLQPDGHIAYFGTSNGCVEIWDLETMEKKTELRYLIFNEFNEQIPIEEPVVNLAAPASFDYVYAFMGVAAYCIDAKLRTIIQQIPIAEPVIWGAVSSENGEIGVLTNLGYLSRWSPKFFERTASIEFNVEIDEGYLLHDFDEARIIIILGDDKVIVGNLEGERYTIEFNIPETNVFLKSSSIDKNPFYRVEIEAGCIVIQTNDMEISDSKYSFLENGRLNSEYYLRNLIKQMESEGGEKQYISDQRLARESKDRYNAELESLGEDSHHTPTTKDDSKTLHYALLEYSNEDYDTKSKALTVISKISERYDITSRSIQFAWMKNHEDLSIIDYATEYDRLTEERQEKLQLEIFVSLLISLILLFIAASFVITTEILTILVSISVFQFLLVTHIRLINRWPTLPWINEFRALRFLNILTLLVSITIGAVRYYGITIPFIDTL